MAIVRDFEQCLLMNNAAPALMNQFTQRSAETTIAEIIVIIDTYLVNHNFNHLVGWLTNVTRGGERVSDDEVLRDFETIVLPAIIRAEAYKQVMR